MKKFNLNVSTKEFNYIVNALSLYSSYKWARGDSFIEVDKFSKKLKKQYKEEVEKNGN